MTSPDCNTRTAQLRSHFSRSSTPRPLFTSLNGDNSWLLSYPRPDVERAATGKAYYHVVTDPWLSGPSTTWASWLVYLSLTEEPCAKNAADIEAIIAEIEAVAYETHASKEVLPEPRKTKRGIDALFINFHYDDHLHEPTLRGLDSDIPVFAVDEAARRMRSWNHFTTVTETQDFDPADPHWPSLHPGASLPSWLNLFRLVGHHELNFATIIVWSHDQKHEALLSSPHGIYDTQDSFQAFATKSEPPIRVTAFLAALHDSFAVGRRTTLGVKGGLALERILKPKYWIPTHDGVLRYWGAFMWLAAVHDVWRTLESGLEEEGKGGERPNLVNVKNGELFVVE
ncbi:hypothetical protein K505DRAFT_328641 [Melanomma pulvis-pyrius CBS 109.77]|uniref:Uncharacterized protein n=1 Tax=Melanomma pulvis-pyrius CBS 109.77 TaxID=1314802 RepID=A0A6A6WY51_9PLEO|nr:hypothetical protein K505DRAFT_328641 [Melanomma pulvis-pyrius CBS 109.77]